jgi:predicted RNase H-like HicB family nuclease
MKEKSVDYTALRDELSAAAESLRSALRDGLESVLPALEGARACGRALGLKRQLGWRAYTVATATDLSVVLEAMPRRAGWQLILESLRRAGCTQKRLQSLSRAVEAMLGPIESGRINRPMLLALAAGRLDNVHETLALLKARRAAREGSERIHGIRCKAQVGAYVIGPADADGWVDIVTLLEYDGLQRLRPGPAMPVKAMNRMWHSEWNESRTSSPLGADAGQGGLVADLSTPGAWERHLRLRDAGGKPIIHFEAGSAGDSSSVRLVFAEHIERGGTVGKAEDLVDLLLAVNVPGEFCVFEAWVHRSHRRVTDPVASLQGMLNPMGSFSDMIGVAPLPLEADAGEVGKVPLPPGLRDAGATHAKALERVSEALGAGLADFVGFRVIVPDAPVGSRVHLRWRM